MKRPTDVVVLIPGLLGSRLMVDKDEAWGTTGELLSGLPAWGRGSHLLRLDPTRTSNVVAPSVVTEAHAIPGLVKMSGYGALANQICSQLNLQRTRTFLEFAYDWRLDCRAAARALEERTRHWLGFAAAEARDRGAGPPKLVLVAHSTGGLVARYYLEKLGGWANTRALLTIATPYHGTLAALEALVNGVGPRFDALTAAVRSWPALYQMLPRFPCIRRDESDDHLTTVGSAKLPNIDPDLLADAMEFHQEIDEAVQKRVADGVTQPYAVLAVVGYAQSTPITAAQRDDGIVVDGWPSTRASVGDGIVPRFSGVPAEFFRGNASVIWAPGCHATLCDGVDYLAPLRQLLVPADANRSPPAPALPRPAGIGLNLPKFALESEPFEIAATSHPDARVVAWITDLDRALESSLELTPDKQDPTTFRASVTLNAGTHRVTLKSARGDDASTAVGDIIVVLPDIDRPRPLAALLWTDEFVTIDANSRIEDLLRELRATGSSFAIVSHQSALFAVESATVRAAVNAHAHDAIVAALIAGRDEPPTKIVTQRASFIDLGDATGKLIACKDGKPFSVGYIRRPIVSIPTGRRSVNTIPGSASQVVTLSRTPTVDMGSPKPGEIFVVRVSLAASLPGSPQILIEDVRTDWTDLAVEVRISSPDLVYDHGESAARGTILLRSAGESIPATFALRTREDIAAGAALPLVVGFFCQGRSCGTIIHRASMASAEPHPLSGTTPMPSIHSLSIARDTAGPHLTVEVHTLDPKFPGELFWVLNTRNTRTAGLPPRLDGRTSLGQGTANFLATLMAGVRKVRAGAHMNFMLGIGKKLFELTPSCFKEAYTALRGEHGNFPIQFIVDDPNIPWELMSPTATSLLAMDHPVARWHLDQKARMVDCVHGYGVATIAPGYDLHSGNVPPLPMAQEESRAVVQRFRGSAVAGTYDAVAELLSTQLGNQEQNRFSILHFAGHARFNLKDPGSACMILEDADMTAVEVSGIAGAPIPGSPKPLVMLNACEAGATSELLGTSWGFADAFLRAGCAGFLAPLWPVVDSVAAKHVLELMRLILEDRRTIANALYELRSKDGATSPTVLSYVFVGDVMARLR